MAWFGFGKEKEIIDLSERYRELKEKKAEENSEIIRNKEEPKTNPNSFFAGLVAKQKAEQENQDATTIPSSESVEERKRKLAKRLTEMSNKIEEMSNQIYKLQRRVEVLERKTGTSGFE